MGSTDLPPGDSLQSNDSDMGTNISVEVMVAAVIFLFLVIVFVFFLYLYMKNFWGSSLSARRRARHIFAASEAQIPSRGLDAAVLRSLPVTIFNKKDFKEGLECSVCLCEVSDGEKARLLPKCRHGFHVECIDMWFHSHSTCPLCRAAVGENESASVISAGDEDEESRPESPIFPTNVLFWGNQDQVNSRSGSNSARDLVIALPNIGGFAAESMKSPSEEARSSPGASKLRSLRRLWSRGRRTGDSSCSSPIGGDVEQGFGFLNGEGSSGVPKSPISS